MKTVEARTRWTMTRWQALAASLVAVAALIVIAGCSSGGDNESATQTSVAATATAAVPTATPQPLAGYERHSFGDGRTIDLPEGWLAMSLDEETLSGFASASAEELPDVFENLGGVDALEQFLAQGMQFMAFDTVNTSATFAPNVNILTEELPFEMSLENYMRLTIDNLESVGVQIQEEDSISTSLGGRETRVIEYSLPGSSSRSMQYLWIEGEKAWIVTFSYEPGDEARYQSVGEAAVASVQ